MTDNGIGLSPEARKRVFEKYYRVPTGNVHDVKGFGLGLSYARLIVKAHGGSIGVRSEEGQGIDVRDRDAVPAKRAGTDDGRGGEMKGKRNPAAPFRDPSRSRILLVEDDLNLGEVIRDLARDQGL